MYINNSNISMSSTGYSSTQTKEIIKSTVGNDISISENTYSKTISTKNDSVKNFTGVLKSEMIDSTSESIEQSLIGFKSSPKKISFGENFINKSTSDIRLQSLLYLIRFFYNRLWRNTNEDFSSYMTSLNSNTDSFGSISDNDSDENIIGSRQIYLEYSENEEMNFKSTGVVSTSDGRQIEFGIDVTLSRNFNESFLNEEDIIAMNTVNSYDPLVINLDTDSVKVMDQKFYFDIDTDGILDEISNLGSASGYLAIDLNNDNAINNGSELFGTKTGNGFMDLSMYDEDGNGWIDEADDVFSKLLIWTKDEDGNDILYHLKDKGVGAICLQNIGSDFSLKNDDNITNAIIRHSGMFLYENGNVGTIQQIDLAT